MEGGRIHRILWNRVNENTQGATALGARTSCIQLLLHPHLLPRQAGRRETYLYEGFIYIRMKRQLLLGEAISTWQVIRQQIAISPWIHHIPRALRAPFRALGAFFSGGRAAPRALGMKREMDAKGEQPFTIPSPCEGAPEPGGPRSTRATPAQRPHPLPAATCAAPSAARVSGAPSRPLRASAAPLRAPPRDLRTCRPRKCRSRCCKGIPPLSRPPPCSKRSRGERQRDASSAGAVISRALPRNVFMGCQAGP